MKYKVGDRVRIKPKSHFCTVDGFNNINMKDEFFNQYSRLPYCETIMTIGIVNKDFYLLKEDKWAYKWTDDMFECKVEEETKPKMVNLDDVCEWLENHDMKEHIGVMYSGVCSIKFHKQGLIDALCKAMED